MCRHDTVGDRVVHLIRHGFSLDLEREVTTAVGHEFELVVTLPLKPLDLGVSPGSGFACVLQILPLKAVGSDDKAAIVTFLPDVVLNGGRSYGDAGTFDGHAGERQPDPGSNGFRGRRGGQM